MPSIVRLSDEDKVTTARRLYLGGFAFLPLLWIMNYLLFQPILNKPETPAAVKTCTCLLDSVSEWRNFR